MVSLSKKPVIENKPENDTGSSGRALARFIAEGDKRPSENASRPLNFRFPGYYVELLGNESETTGMNKTVVLKAALLAFRQLDQNEKNIWLLKAVQK